MFGVFVSNQVKNTKKDKKDIMISEGLQQNSI